MVVPWQAGVPVGRHTRWQVALPATLTQTNPSAQAPALLLHGAPSTMGPAARQPVYRSPVSASVANVQPSDAATQSCA